MMLSRLLLPLMVAVIAVGQTAVSQPAPSLDERAYQILTEGLKDKNPDVRKQAVIALSLSGENDQLFAMLESMLDDKDVEVRLAAVASLVDLKGKGTTAALHKALKDNVPEVSFAAARALWGMDDPAGKQALLAVLAHETKTSSGFFTKEKRQAMRMMHTPKTAFMFAVKQGAGLAPVPGLGAGVSSMEALMTDSGVSGRGTAVLLLGKDADAEILPALKEALNDKDWAVRAAAVHSIALRDDPALQPDLAPLLTDSKEAVRLRSAAGYLRLESIKKMKR